MQEYHKKMKKHTVKILSCHHTKDWGFFLGRHSGKMLKYKGTTTVLIEVDGVQYEGTAFCSVNDQFNDATGYNRAHGRAVKLAAIVFGYLG